MKQLIIYLLFDIILISSFIRHSLCLLSEPIEIEILPGISYHFSVEYCTFSVPPYITTMNALCYCRYNPTTQISFDCSIPGPTFIIHPGHKIQMTIHNKLSGISNPLIANVRRDLDITNIHTHGLRMSHIIHFKLYYY